MKLLFGFALLMLLLTLVLLLAIGMGGPASPPPMDSINRPFQAVEEAGLPPLSHYTARDGNVLAFRHYRARADSPKGSVVLLHGSAASSRSMHALARAFMQAGYSVYALDVRGHGDSGAKGQITYVGQLEDDLQDLVRAVTPADPMTLVGFSSGGGFVLRVAGSRRQTLFDSYLFLSPFISQEASTYRSDSGGWISLGLPRYIALTMLDRLGVTVFNHLPVMRFAVGEAPAAFLTRAYSFNLARNYRPRPDFRKTIASMKQPARLLVGMDDEVFHSDRFEAVFKAAGNPVPITRLPGVNHVGLILEPGAQQAAVEAVDALSEAP